MQNGRNLTLREHAEERAMLEFHTHRGNARLLAVELYDNEKPDDDVKRYGAADLGRGMVRVGVVYHWPGRDGALFIGGDFPRSDATRWLCQHGVPAVRLSRIGAS